VVGDSNSDSDGDGDDDDNDDGDGVGGFAKLIDLNVRQRLF
jgi:hypothetical protein